jgi:hypothetical protein
MMMCLTACLSFGRGSVVHAMAPDFVSIVATADTIAHCAADGDRVSGDKHKAAIHHHTAFHGHKIGIPPADGELVVALPPAPGFTPTLRSLAADARLDAMKRPPKA